MIGFWILISAVIIIALFFARLPSDVTMVASDHSVTAQPVSARTQTNVNSGGQTVAIGEISGNAKVIINQKQGEEPPLIFEPNVKVNMVKSSDAYSINIESSKPLNSLAIDLPVLGIVKSIKDENSIVDGRTAIKRVVGSNSEFSQNNVELMIENIKPSAKLEYKVFFKPLPSNFYIAGADRYKISYTWNSAGESKTKSKWISLQTGNETEEPTVQLRGVTFTQGGESPEESKKHDEEGLKKHNFGD
jgi:hypothetical protein